MFSPRASECAASESSTNNGPRMTAMAHSINGHSTTGGKLYGTWQLALFNFTFSFQSEMGSAQRGAGQRLNSRETMNKVWMRGSNYNSSRNSAQFTLDILFTFPHLFFSCKESFKKLSIFIAIHKLHVYIFNAYRLATVRFQNLNANQNYDSELWKNMQIY